MDEVAKGGSKERTRGERREGTGEGGGQEGERALAEALGPSSTSGFGTQVSTASCCMKMTEEGVRGTLSRITGCYVRGRVDIECLPANDVVVVWRTVMGPVTSWLASTSGTEPFSSSFSAALEGQERRGRSAAGDRSSGVGGGGGGEVEGETSASSFDSRA
jgi:hypothetical protein